MPLASSPFAVPIVETLGALRKTIGEYFDHHCDAGREHRQMQTRRERGPSLSCLERRITKHARLQTVGKNPDERRGIAELSGLME